VVVVGDLVAQFVDLGRNPALSVVDLAVDAAFGVDTGGEVTDGVIFKAPFVALRVGVGDEPTQKNVVCTRFLLRCFRSSIADRAIGYYCKVSRIEI
jgi:hypothetical protein